MSDYRERISPKLLSKLRILMLMQLIFFVIAVVHLVRDPHQWRWAIVGMAIGIAIGVFMTMFDRYVWHEGDDKVVVVSNAFATVILVAYMIFALNKGEILDNWISRPEALSMATTWLTVGVLGTRIWRMRSDIGDVLKNTFPVLDQ